MAFSAAPTRLAAAFSLASSRPHFVLWPTRDTPIHWVTVAAPVEVAPGCHLEHRLFCVQEVPAIARRREASTSRFRRRDGVRVRAHLAARLRNYDGASVRTNGGVRSGIRWSASGTRSRPRRRRPDDSGTGATRRLRRENRRIRPLSGSPLRRQQPIVHSGDERDCHRRVPVREWMSTRPTVRSPRCAACSVCPPAAVVRG